MYMRHLGLGVGHKRDEHGNDGDQSKSMEVDSFDLGLQPTAPELHDHDSSEYEINRNEESVGDDQEDQEEDGEEDDLADDEEIGSDNEEQEGSEDEDSEDSGYDEL